MADIREQMLAELKEVLGSPIPEWAMTLQQILEEKPDTVEKKLRTWLREKIASGKWATARRGNAVYYWKVNDAEGTE